MMWSVGLGLAKGTVETWKMPKVPDKILVDNFGYSKFDQIGREEDLKGRYFKDCRGK